MEQDKSSAIGESDDKAQAVANQEAFDCINIIIASIEQESRRLAELRDTLLPKLMSGELKVN